MKIALDIHTHTIASGHAYSTMREMVKAASEKGLELLGITEHAIAMPGTCHEYYFHNLKVVPRELFGVQLLLGTEANIMNFAGDLDMDSYTLKNLDIVIASLHTACYESGTPEQNTSALISAMKNPFVNIIGHPDDGRIPLIYEPIIKTAKEEHILIELNNSSLRPTGFRKNTKENAIEYLTLCKKYEVPILLGSDAHVEEDIANYDHALPLLASLDFPEKLVLNRNKKEFLDFLSLRKQ